MINYIVHKASDKVIRMDSLLVSDSEYGKVDTTFNNVNLLSNDDIDNLYEAIKEGDIDFNVTIEHTGEPTEYMYYLRGEYKEQNPHWTDPDGTGNDPDVNGVPRYAFQNDEWQPTDGVDIDPYVPDPSNPNDVQWRYKIANPEWDNDGSYTDPDANGNPRFIDNVHLIYYNKYPVTSFGKFPDSFPEVHYVINYAPPADDASPADYNAIISANEPVISDYDTMVEHQAVYGELDRIEWDIADDKIFNEQPYTTTSPAVRTIPKYYKLHHYMVPVLNNIVVLIKAVNK